MGLRLNLPVAKSVRAAVGTELTLIPDRKLHRQRRIERRLAATPPQTGAHAERAAIAGQLKVLVRLVVTVVDRIMGGAPQHAAQGDLGTGVEEMINAQAQFGSVAEERFLLVKFALADFRVIVGEAAAGQPEAEVRVWAERAADPQRRLQAGGRDRQPQRQICAQELRLVAVIIGI